jgi:ABC-type branched-subunit amino acid transport system ATPase component
VILEVDGVDFSYGRLQVLFGVSLRVAPGESVALLGTNGAGKSTLLRAVVGLGRPTRGRVVFDGDDITAVRTEELAARGLVLVKGDRGIFPDMTVQDNLELAGLAIRRDRKLFRKRRDEVLDTLPVLRSRASQVAGTLSGGEQQQLALARALILQPKLLCVDELSLGLAPVIVQELMQIIRAVNSRGVAVLLVEQSLNIAAQLCGRAVFMEKGAVRFEGAPAELLDNDDVARAVFLGDQGAKPTRREPAPA